MSVLDGPERMHVLQALLQRRDESREVLDELARSVAVELGHPIALVSIVLDDAQVFLGAHGLEGWLAEVRGTPLEWSFCAHVVRDAEPLEVPDATADARFSENPLVTIDGIRSYFGVPLEASTGDVLGSLCVISDRPAQLDEAAIGRLREHAARAVAVLESKSV